MLQPKSTIFKGTGYVLVTGLRAGICSCRINGVQRVQLLRSNYVIYTACGSRYTYPSQSVTLEVICVK